MDLQNWPDHSLIHRANATDNKDLQAAIDLELEQRYEEIREELKEYEEFNSIP